MTRVTAYFAEMIRNARYAGELSAVMQPRRPFTSLTCGLLLGLAPALLAPALAVVGATSADAQSALPAPPAAAAVAKAPAKAKAKAAAPAEQEQAAEADAGAAKTPQKPKKRDPAEAMRSVDSGVALLKAGKAEQAIGTFSAVISGGNLPPSVMAKALHNRGLAYSQTKKPAQAISDLTSALWLKGGLADAERADALQARSAAYRDAGLPDQTNGSESASAAATPAADRPARPTKSAAAITTAATTASTAPAARTAAPVSLAPGAQADVSAPAPTSSGGNFFSNLFGGGSTAAQPAKSGWVAAPPQAEVGQAWSSTTRIQSQKAAALTQPAPAAVAQPEPQKAQRVATATVAPAAAVAPPAAAGGRFKAQVALVRSAEEAQAVVAKLKAQYVAALAQREPVVDQASLGNMGSFFRVRVGPYASQAEAQGVCAGLKGSGWDCVPVSQ
jgi:tetratricopeptide (TPR) repeat protein